MSGKNNLDGIKFKQTRILPKLKNKVGRPPTKPGEKESETLILKITKAEMQVIRDKAGIMPLSTWFKNEVRTKGDIFK